MSYYSEGKDSLLEEEMSLFTANFGEKAAMKRVERLESLSKYLDSKLDSFYTQDT
jgi:hypothetical protein